MIEPMHAFDIGELAKKTSALLPSATPSSVSPIPTVVPDTPTYQRVGDAGEKTLWIVFVIMFLSTIVFSFMAYRVPVQKRLFHVLTAFITLFATLSYFAMATGDGNSYNHVIVKETHKHTPSTVEHVFRQVFWARYVDWSVTTPLLLLDLAFLAGLNGANIIVAIVADLVMILGGLFAAFGSNDGQKWGWYTFACIAYIVIIYQLAIPGRRAVSTKDNKTNKLFVSIAGFTLILWTLYPVVWGLGEGSRLWTVDGEIIAYAILDVLAKPVFGFWLLFAHGDNAATSVEGWWSRGLSSEGSIRIEDEDGA